jgi:hypothetical protein
MTNYNNWVDAIHDFVDDEAFEDLTEQNQEASQTLFDEAIEDDYVPEEVQWPIRDCE